MERHTAHSITESSIRRLVRWPIACRCWRSRQVWSCERPHRRSYGSSARHAKWPTLPKSAALLFVSILTRRLTPLVNHGRTVPSRYLNNEGYNDCIEHYEGRVHCVQVPNGLLFVRRTESLSCREYPRDSQAPAGDTVSQESLRFRPARSAAVLVPGVGPGRRGADEAGDGPADRLEQFQLWMAGHFGLDDDGVEMHEKKAKTSFMRRFAPEGVATGLVWTANIRTLRAHHRGADRPGGRRGSPPGVQQDRRVLCAKAPGRCLSDCTVTLDGTWIPGWRKV